jgi:hypothetical protein
VLKAFVALERMCQHEDKLGEMEILALEPRGGAGVIVEIQGT